MTNGRVLILNEWEYNRLEKASQENHGLTLQEYVRLVFGPDVTVLTYDRVGGSDV